MPRGRTGVTDEQVRQAYLNIIKVNGNPTVRNIRALLGDTGSLSTISAALHRVKHGTDRPIKADSTAALEERIARLEGQVAFLLDHIDEP